MKDTQDIKKMLLNQMDDLCNGKVDVKNSNAVAKLASQIIYASRLEIENKRLELEINTQMGDDDRLKKYLSSSSSKISSIEF